MTFKTSLFALTLACLALLTSGCGGYADAESETDSVTSAVTGEVRVPFSSGHATGMTAGTGALVDAPLDGFLGWRGPDVTIPGIGTSQQPALIYEHGYAAPDTATATLFWKKYMPEHAGTHMIIAPRQYKVAGTLTVSGLGPVSTGRVELVVETLLMGDVIKSDSTDVVTLSASTGQRSVTFNQLVSVSNVFDVLAFVGQSLQYRAKLVLHVDTNSSGKARFAIRWFGMYTNASPNTDQTITIQTP